MNLFFYGTLMDSDVRQLVCGKRLDAAEPAVAQGFRRVHVEGRHYPMMLPHASGWVEGTLVRGVDAESLHRLQVYEGWEYGLHAIKVRTASGASVMAQVFLCPPHVNAHNRDWRLEQWQLRHKRAFLPKARQLMERALKTGRMPGAPVSARPRPVLASRPLRRKK
ncbi:gamma-glutamylcyclotransferase family protein [Magnetospirillum aberrantis]|uniref:gamma-glutamylcyclotransferase family protein n=1 Tax=Magnetospirillum aberrantis TaxID=1105283 RepID=UPI001F1207D7|nr:gamma-glutamylcyclotransferase family protein [Magnetospirillum aberrantis]